MLTRTETSPYRPRLVLALADSAQTASSARHLRRHGWEVHPAATAAEARRLTVRLSPEVVILDARLPDESGWLTCAKLRVHLPEQKVVLVDSDPSLQNQRFGNFVGAACVVSGDDDLLSCVEERIGLRVPA